MKDKYSHMQQNVWEAKKKELIELIQEESRIDVIDKTLNRLHDYSKKLLESLNQGAYVNEDLIYLQDKKNEVILDEDKVSNLAQIYYNSCHKLHENSGKTLDNLNDVIISINNEMDYQILGGKNE